MSRDQNKFYWRRWCAVARANQWRMDKNRLLESAAATEASSEHHEAVWAAARARARQRQRSVTADDLRHGCHVAALGRDKSHLQFSNKEFDALLALWGDERTCDGLLVEPLHLGSEIYRANPELKVRERHLHFLRNDCIGSYVAAESERIYGTKDWEALDTESLLGLSNHLRARPNAARSSIGRIDSELVPF